MIALLCLWTLLAGPFAARPAPKEVRVLASDHQVDMAHQVTTRWALAEPAPPNTRFVLAWPLAADVELSSDDVAAERDLHGKVVALVTGRPLRVDLTLRTTPGRRETPHVPLAAPAGQVVQRVHFAQHPRLALAHARILQGALIRTSATLGRDARRAADRALDGPRAHRQAGSLYFRASDGPLSVSPSAAQERKPSVHVVGVLLFAASLLAALWLLRWGTTRMRRERVDAYLSRVLSEEDRKLLELSDPQEP